MSCELCNTGICTPQNPLTLSGFLLNSDAGDGLYAAGDLLSGDINADGISDLVVLNTSNIGGAATLGWSFGLSDGGFIDFQYLSLEPLLGKFSGNNWLVVGDFNKDGFADAVLTYSNGTNYQMGAYLFRGSANGLAPVSEIWNGLSTADNGTGVGDVNGDGWPDLVVGSDNAYVLLNLTDGGFMQAAEIANPPPGESFTRFAVADLNGDGLPDLVVPGDPFAGAYRTQVAYQLSDGGFGAWTALSKDPDSTSVTNYGSTVVVSARAQVALVVATGPGGVCDSPSVTLSPSPAIWDSATVDLNNDGVLDVVSLGTTGLVSFLRTPTGWDSKVLAPPAPGGPNLLAALADGRVVVSDPADQRILIFDDGCVP